MNKVFGPDVPYDGLCAAIVGITFFAAGIIIADIYVFIAGAWLIAAGIVVLMGAKIVDRMDEAARYAKSDDNRLSVLSITR